MKSVLVTGAAGFIGSVVAHQLARQGLNLVLVDNFDDYYVIDLKKHRWDGIASTNKITKRACDIRDFSELSKVFDQHDFEVVINLAAMAGVRNSIADPQKYIDVNISGLLNVLECMRKHNVPRLVQASTSSLYAGHEMPFVEDLDVRTPISPYAASKLGAEALTYSYHHIHGIDTTILRYFTVYGPAGRPDMAPFKFAEWILNKKKIELYGDGFQTRDFTFVDDIARGTITAATKAIKGWNVINLGGGMKPISILDFIENLSDALNVKARICHLPPVQGDMLHTSADISKAKRILDWQPEVDIATGILELANWHYHNRGFIKKAFPHFQ